MFLQRGFRCLKKKFSLCNKKVSYERIPEEKEERQVIVPKGYIPIIVGEFDEGSEEGKKYMIRVEYLSNSIFIALINRLWEEKDSDLDLEDDVKGPMRLPCSPSDFEEILNACDLQEKHHHKIDPWRRSHYLFS